MPTPHVSPWRDSAPGPSLFFPWVDLGEEGGRLSSAGFRRPLCGRQPICRTHVSCLSLPCRKGLLSMGEDCGFPTVQGMAG